MWTVMIYRYASRTLLRISILANDSRSIWWMFADITLYESLLRENMVFLCEKSLIVKYSFVVETFPRPQYLLKFWNCQVHEPVIISRCVHLELGHWFHHALLIVCSACDQSCSRDLSESFPRPQYLLKFWNCQVHKNSNHRGYRV